MKPCEAHAQKHGNIVKKGDNTGIQTDPCHSYPMGLKRRVAWHLEPEKTSIFKNGKLFLQIFSLQIVVLAFTLNAEQFKAYDDIDPIQTPSRYIG